MHETFCEQEVAFGAASSGQAQANAASSRDSAPLQRAPGGDTGFERWRCTAQDRILTLLNYKTPLITEVPWYARHDYLALLMYAI